VSSKFSWLDIGIFVINAVDSVNEEYKLIPFEEFYNEAINEHLEIKEDFPHWKANEGLVKISHKFNIK
jgi:hypothetical protein